jgi:hypothetical protein
VPRQGTFVLADLSGYTGYLDAAGLEHASKVTAKLLNALIQANGKRWQVANLEGDCIFFFQEAREPPGPLLAHVTRLFESFFLRVLDMGQDTDCGCGACGGSNQLALKFIVHAGEYAEQKVGGRRELVGPDVVAAHRLLKNEASAREYVLLTDAYLGDDRPEASLQLIGGGGLPAYQLDLAPTRRDLEATHAVFVSARQSGINLAAQIHAPPLTVWNALLDPAGLHDWSGAHDVFCFPAGGGKVGTVVRLIMPDGRDFVQLVIAADDRRRLITFRRADLPFTRYVYTTYEVGDEGNAARLRCYLAANTPIPMPTVLWARHSLKSEMTAGLARLKARCEAGGYSR